MDTRTEIKDSLIEAWIDFADTHEGEAVRAFDSKQPGLRIRVGKRSVTWVYYHDAGTGTDRKITSKTLGRFDRGVPSGDTAIRAPWHMNTADARKAAAIASGRVIGGHFEPSKRNARKFADAFASYLDYLQAKADDEGKPARWRRNVEQLGNQLLLPKWGKWSLLDMSKRREGSPRGMATS